MYSGSASEKSCLGTHVRLCYTKSSLDSSRFLPTSRNVGGKAHIIFEPRCSNIKAHANTRGEERTNMHFLFSSCYGVPREHCQLAPWNWIEFYILMVSPPGLLIRIFEAAGNPFLPVMVILIYTSLSQDAAHILGETITSR